MNVRVFRRATLSATCLAGLILTTNALVVRAATAPSAGKTRTYYVAADEVNWDYAPSGRDEAMGMEFDAVAKGFTETSANHIGRVYKKAIYREYTDATFTSSNRARPRSNTSAWWDPFCTQRSATPSRSSSRTTEPTPTACIRTASSTKKTPRARTTTTAPAAQTKPTAASRPASPTPTPGRFPSAPAPAPTIPAASSGSTTRTATSCATWPRV